MVIKMLNLTLTSGDGVQIGEDVQIVFESTPSVGRIKIKIEAPGDKNIARMPAEKKRKGNVVIVKSGRLSAEGCPPLLPRGYGVGRALLLGACAGVQAAYPFPARLFTNPAGKRTMPESWSFFVGYR